MNIIKASIASPTAKIAIAIARFNDFINKNLLTGAIDTIERIGQVTTENITVVWVPGAYEIPLAVKMLISTKKYDAIIALASIIKGVTKHFEYIASECSARIANLALSSNVPVTFGILTTDNIKQAIERAGTKAGNKGADAALAALEMVNIIKAIK